MQSLVSLKERVEGDLLQKRKRSVKTEAEIGVIKPQTKESLSAGNWKKQGEGVILQTS